MVESKKLMLVISYYKLHYGVVTGKYDRIVIVIMHQLLVCNNFALVL